MTRWHLSHRFDPAGCALADRHYNRRAIGSPQFVPPGRCHVLLTAEADALWVTSWPFAEYVRHAWPGAWVCSIFRNESPRLSSDIVLEAEAAAFEKWGPNRLYTYVAPDKIRSVNPGYCFKVAGWKYVRLSASGQHLLSKHDELAR